MNCGYGRGFTVREVVETVKDVSGVDFEVRPAPRRPGDPPALVAEASELGARTSWSPAHDTLDEIVETALAWEQRLRRRS